MMYTFIESIKLRNETLFLFGLANLVLGIAFFMLSRFTDVQVLGANAWIKPFKFAISTWLFSWAMAWYIYYLNEPRFATVFNWVIIVTLGFEVIYIALQAGRGQLSHFNLSTPLYSGLYSLMAIAASVATLATALVGFKFFGGNFPDLQDYYLWSIRLAICLFVIFSFEGFVMGARLTHTIGGPDGGPGLPILNWSYRYGDPRIAHFVGMHALQVLPILAYYLIKDLKMTFVLSFLYACLAVFVLIQALTGRPLFKI